MYVLFSQLWQWALILMDDTLLKPRGFVGQLVLVYNALANRAQPEG